MLINIDGINEIFFAKNSILFSLKYEQLDLSEDSLRVGLGDNCDIKISEKEFKKLKSDVRLLCN